MNVETRLEDSSYPKCLKKPKKKRIIDQSQSDLPFIIAYIARGALRKEEKLGGGKKQ